MYATFEKDKLDPNCMLLQVDFAMAYNCDYQHEIQSVNLFMGAIYNAEGKEEPFLIVTNSPDIGKNSVCTLMLEHVDEITFIVEKELIIYSDGPSSEFKNQFITRKLLYLLSQQLNLPVSYKVAKSVKWP